MIRISSYHVIVRTACTISRYIQCSAYIYIYICTGSEVRADWKMGADGPRGSTEASMRESPMPHEVLTTG